MSAGEGALTEIEELAQFDGGELAGSVRRHAREEERGAQRHEVDNRSLATGRFDEVMARVICSFDIGFL